MKLVRNIRVRNRLGLHTRPATTIVKLLQACQSDVYFTHNQETANAKSILSLLMLAAGENSEITIMIDGEDAKTMMEKLIEAFENQFGE